MVYIPQHQQPAQNAAISTFGKPNGAGQPGPPAAVNRTHDAIVFQDAINTITDRIDGVRLVRGRDVTTYHHADAEADVLVYGDGSVWWYGFANKVSHVFSESRADAESLAMRVFKSSLKTIAASSGAAGLTQRSLFE